MVLSDLRCGEKCKIIKFNKIGKTTERLKKMGLTENIKVYVVRFGILNDPILIMVRDFMLAIRKDDAKNIIVEKL